MKNKLYDPVRKSFVFPLPEERVRQKLLSLMINSLGFPLGLLAVEKDVKNLTHLQNKDFSAAKRRVDILCFGKNIHPLYELYPLLIVECKACKLTQAAIEQVLGYNHFIKSFFVCIANSEENKVFWYNKKDQEYNSLSFLPHYNQLLQAIKSANQ